MPDDQNTFKAVVEAEEQRRLELLNSIRTNIAEDLKHDETETCARRSLGDMNFIALVPLVKQALEIIRRYQDLNLESLSRLALESVGSQIGMVHNPLIELRRFRLDDPQASGVTIQRRDEVQSRVEQQLVPAIKEAQKYLPVARALSETGDQFTYLRNEMENLISAAKKSDGDLKAIVTAAREATSKLGVDSHAPGFGRTASSHGCASICWAAAAGLFGLATILAAIYFATMTTALANLIAGSQPPNPPLNVTDSHFATINWLVSKIVTISILYLGTIWALRNYRANKHLAVVNQHRQNALSTFKSFVEGSDEKSIRDAVLLEATRCVFAASVTGYLGPDENTPNPISEALKVVATKSVS